MKHFRLAYRRSLRCAAEVLSDVAAVLLAWYLASQTGDGSRITELREAILIWIAAAVSLRIYSRAHLPGVRRHLNEVLRVALLVDAAVAVPLLATPSAGAKLWFTVTFVVVFPAVLLAGRMLILRFALFAGKRWPARPNIALVGNAERAAGIAWRFRQNNAVDVRGVILPGTFGYHEAKGVAILGRTANLAELINREKLDTLVLVDDDIPERELQVYTEVSARMGVRMTWTLSPALDSENLSYWEDCGVPLFEVEPERLTQTQRFLKRAVDILGSFALIVLLAPLLSAIAVLIRITSPGPILFAAPRVGRGGRYFMFWKFRSMYTDTKRSDVHTENEQSGHLFKVRNDPRVTPLGRYLRRYSLDELPQLFNVLLGDMSLVGPRPLPIEDLGPDGMSRTFTIWSEQRASVPPGITGLWQIRGRSDLSFRDLVRFDLEYIHNWSLGLDFEILLKTPFEVFTGRGAY